MWRVNILAIMENHSMICKDKMRMKVGLSEATPCRIADIDGLFFNFTDRAIAARTAYLKELGR
jgi:hypothetical protein